MKVVQFCQYALVSIALMLVMSCSDDDSTPDPIPNEYELDGVLYPITTDMYWDMSGGQGDADQLRLKEPLVDSFLFDLIVISPVPGPSTIEGDYVYSKTDDIGTYDLVFLHATDGVDTTEWFTNGDNGASLEIRSMGNQDGQEIYRVIIPEFTLNYGFWDYLAGKWVSLGQKSFKLSYEGPILN